MPDNQTGTQEVTGHALGRGIVLEDLKIIYVPVPKAACTSVLWLLADLAGFKQSRFASSSMAEVTTALTIHDLSRWPGSFQIRQRSEEWVAEACESAEWFVFTVVREPTSRVWSAWQSKLLLREPQFLRRYGDEPWFPRRPIGPTTVLHDFRRFVDAVIAGEARGSHWDPQSELLAPLSYTHVGHLEGISETLELLRDHLGGHELPPMHQRNPTPLPSPWHVLGFDVQEALADAYGRDLDRFGYSRPHPPAPREVARNRERWHETARIVIPLLDQVIERNRRIGRLEGLLREATAPPV